MLAWFLTGLAGHLLREVLAFNGGTALRCCWFEDYRFSEDLDFTLTRAISLETILAGLDEIFVAVEAACGLRIAFEREDRPIHPTYDSFIGDILDFSGSTFSVFFEEHTQRDIDVTVYRKRSLHLSAPPHASPPP